VLFNSFKSLRGICMDCTGIQEFVLSDKHESLLQYWGGRVTEMPRIGDNPC
jgi:hypothetical protein